MGLAARYFNGNAEDTLLSRVTPTQKQVDYLQAWWNALADTLREDLAELGYAIERWIQGSYKFGTLIRPVVKGEQYDVDVGIYFVWERDEGEAEPAPEQLREWVQRAAQAYAGTEPEVRRVVEPPKARCTRVEYQQPFHVDLPVYHFERSSDTYRLAALPNVWEDSDPKALYKWFKAQVGRPERDQLRRVVRYLKAWAASRFEPTSRPASVLLTVLSTEAYAEGGLADLDLADDDAFHRVNTRVLIRLQANRRVPNPVKGNEDLNDMPKEACDAFLEQLEELVDAGDKAAEAEDEVGAVLAWADALTYLMPLPDLGELEVVDEGGRAVMIVPNIRIDVTDTKTGRALRTHFNEVPSVAKNCSLRFTITNQEIIPAYATVEWTVRNHGDEAEAIGDIGHRNPLGAGLVIDEHTAYSGRHYMDCMIRHDGHVLAARRVPVRVTANPLPVRNPPRPAYVKMQTRIGRRRHR